MSKELMKRCAFCEEIKFGFAGFDIKMNEEDEWVWICDTKECVNGFIQGQLLANNRYSMEVKWPNATQSDQEE